jgi:hypothetical protein
MFGKSIERIAYEYLIADVNQQESLKRELLKNPIKSTVPLVVLGAVVLKRFGKANLNTPYREAPEHIYKRAMIFQEKIVSKVANFVTIVGDEGILKVCDALTASDIQIAIFAGFVLTYNSGYSFDVLQKIDTSLHNLSGALTDRTRTLLGLLIILIQAQENFGQAASLLQREAFRKGIEVKVIGNSIMAEALDYLLPYEIAIQKQEQRSSNDDEWAAKWTHYWNWVDPDNAPWNYD